MLFGWGPWAIRKLHWKLLLVVVILSYNRWNYNTRETFFSNEYVFFNTFLQNLLLNTRTFTANISFLSKHQTLLQLCILMITTGKNSRMELQRYLSEYFTTRFLILQPGTLRGYESVARIVFLALTVFLVYIFPSVFFRTPCMC